MFDLAAPMLLKLRRIENAFLVQAGFNNNAAVVFDCRIRANPSNHSIPYTLYSGNLPIFTDLLLSHDKHIQALITFFPLASLTLSQTSPGFYLSAVEVF